MKRVVFVAAILVLILTVPAQAQEGEEFCAIPEGCDLDGDGAAETPAGAPVPAGPGEGQYGPEGEFCAIPEGCDASAPPDPVEDASPSPAPPAASVAPVPEEDASPAGSSPPSEEGAGAGSAGASPGASPDLLPRVNAGTGDGSTVGVAPSAASGHRVANLTVLPETGGVPATVPGLGVALAAGALLVRRLSR